MKENEEKTRDIVNFLNDLLHDASLMEKPMPEEHKITFDELRSIFRGPPGMAGPSGPAGPMGMQGPAGNSGHSREDIERIVTEVLRQEGFYSFKADLEYQSRNNLKLI